MKRLKSIALTALLAVVPVISYGLAWIGHFFVEKNAPATFRYPFRSLVADFYMYGLTGGASE